jgi:hypothetical protein
MGAYCFGEHFCPFLLTGSIFHFGKSVEEQIVRPVPPLDLACRGLGLEKRRTSIEERGGPTGDLAGVWVGDQRWQ